MGLKIFEWEEIKTWWKNIYPWGATQAPQQMSECDATISMSEAKSRIRTNAINKWKLRWARNQALSNSNSYLKNINTSRKIVAQYHREIETTVYRLILGHNNLKEHMYRMYPQLHPTPACACNEGTVLTTSCWNASSTQQSEMWCALQ